MPAGSAAVRGNRKLLVEPWGWEGEEESGIEEGI